MNNELFSRLKDLAKKENRARLAVLLGAAAMLLILLSELFTPSEKTAAASAAPADDNVYRQQLEQQLSDLIAQVEGAGTADPCAAGRRDRAGTDSLHPQSVRGGRGVRGRGRCPGRRPNHRAGGGAAGCSVQPHLRRAAPGMIFCSDEI